MYRKQSAGYTCADHIAGTFCAPTTHKWARLLPSPVFFFSKLESHSKLQNMVDSTHAVYLYVFMLVHGMDEWMGVLAWIPQG